MTEPELRDMIRASIARHRAAPPAGLFEPPEPPGRPHASHGLLTLPSGGDIGGPCLIEPAVRCSHCGYCRSYGH